MRKQSDKSFERTYRRRLEMHKTIEEKKLVIELVDENKFYKAQIDNMEMHMKLTKLHPRYIRFLKRLDREEKGKAKRAMVKAKAMQRRKSSQVNMFSRFFGKKKPNI